MAPNEKIEISKSDLVIAWEVLENLAVSLDQIGGKFADETSPANGATNQRALQEALAAYLKPDLVKMINDARTRLGRYIPDEEAEGIAEQIHYWDAAGCKVPDTPI
jgi:hypothetical protein